MFCCFENLYQKFTEDLKDKVDEIAINLRDWYFVNDGKYQTFLKQIPCRAVSIFEDGCIQKGLSYLKGVPIYNVFSPQLGGLADTCDSLYAIKKLVFDEKKLSFKDFMEILKLQILALKTLIFIKYQHKKR